MPPSLSAKKVNLYYLIVPSQQLLMALLYLIKIVHQGKYSILEISCDSFRKTGSRLFQNLAVTTPHSIKLNAGNSPLPPACSHVIVVRSLLDCVIGACYHGDPNSSSNQDELRDMWEARAPSCSHVICRHRLPSHKVPPQQSTSGRSSVARGAMQESD